VFSSGDQSTFIPSEAIPLMPYYSSLADAKLWRDPQLEDALFAPLLKPGFRIEGTLLDNWGNILPRIGFINQLGDYKAAAVLALRAADIATLPLQPHVYWPLPSFSCGIECYVWPSHEDDFLDVKYQEVYPIVSTTAKPTWGSVDPPLSPPIGQAQYQVGGGDYVWVMWRRYRGCIQDNGAFMGSIDF
jgi:integrating conjugative element protein (TIGR03756 family)